MGGGGHARHEYNRGNGRGEEHEGPDVEESAGVAGVEFGEEDSTSHGHAAEEVSPAVAGLL